MAAILMVVVLFLGVAVKRDEEKIVGK